MLRGHRPEPSVFLQQEDADAVATVLIQSRRIFLPFAPSAHPEDDIRHWVATQLIPSARVTVWQEGQSVVAVLATSKDEHYSWINQLYVLPGFEAQRLGSRLLSYAHLHLKKPIRLFTFQQNLGARRFYERHDYKAIVFTDGQSNEEKCPDVLYELRAAETEA